MAGVTDAPFRKIAREFGAGLACTEMISSEALVRQHRESFRLMDLRWDKRPVSVQLMGGDPGVMAQAALLAEAAGADIVDINMGCPVPKVVKTSGGSSLLRDPDRACRVAQAVVGAVSVPVTVKIRLGWDFATRNYLEMASRLETTGIQGLAVHGRTRSQRYDPSADWMAIAEVKSAVSIPVAGSGDLRTADDAVLRRLASGVDAVMLGRGILGNRWLARSRTPRRRAKPPDQGNFCAYGASYTYATDLAAAARRARLRLRRLRGESGRFRYRVRKQRALLRGGLPGPAGGRRHGSPHVGRDRPHRLRDWLCPDAPH